MRARDTLQRGRSPPVPSEDNRRQRRSPHHRGHQRWTARKTGPRQPCAPGQTDFVVSRALPAVHRPL